MKEDMERMPDDTEMGMGMAASDGAEQRWQDTDAAVVWALGLAHGSIRAIGHAPMPRDERQQLDQAIRHRLHEYQQVVGELLALLDRPDLDRTEPGGAIAGSDRWQEPRLRSLGPIPPWPPRYPPYR